MSATTWDVIIDETQPHLWFVGLVDQQTDDIVRTHPIPFEIRAEAVRAAARLNVRETKRRG